MPRSLRLPVRIHLFIVFVLLFFLVLVILVKGTSSVLGRSLLVFLFVVFSGIATVEHRVVFHVGHSRRR